MNNLYDNTCDCSAIPDLADNKDDWDNIYNEIARQLLEGEDLSSDALYKKTAAQLMAALNKGLGGTTFDDDDSRKALQSKFAQNIEQFSYAKTLTQFRLFRDAVFNDKGQVQSFAAVKKIVADTGEVFNNNYLRAEHQYVVQTAIMAHKWKTLDSEYLEFSTAGDNHVRASHKLFDKFTALKTDPIWKRLYTPLDWGCRCIVIPGVAKNVSKEYDSEWANKVVDPLVKGTIFDNNAALTGKIFTDKHPYFKVKETKGINPKLGINIERKAKDSELKQWASELISKGKPLSLSSGAFQTPEVRISKSSIENILKHISNVADKEVVKEIVPILENAKFENSLPLENKDSKNYGSKVARGVVSYNYYSSKWKGRSLKINMEVMKDGYEQPYAILLDKK